MSSTNISLFDRSFTFHIPSGINILDSIKVPEGFDLFKILGMNNPRAYLTDKYVMQIVLPYLNILDVNSLRMVNKGINKMAKFKLCEKPKEKPKEEELTIFSHLDHYLMTAFRIPGVPVIPPIKYRINEEMFKQIIRDRNYKLLSQIDMKLMPHVVDYVIPTFPKEKEIDNVLLKLRAVEDIPENIQNTSYIKGLLDKTSFEKELDQLHEEKDKFMTSHYPFGIYKLFGVRYVEVCVADGRVFILNDKILARTQKRIDRAINLSKYKENKNFIRIDIHQSNVAFGASIYVKISKDYLDGF